MDSYFKKMTYDVQVIVPSISLDEVYAFLSNNKVIEYSFLFVLPSSQVIPHVNLQHIYINQSGSGIYNAINDGIKYSKSKFYLICGCDDYIKINNLMSLNIDDLSSINIFPVTIKNQLHSPIRFLITDAHKALISEHSVGTIIEKKLHEKLGFYDESFKISSDAHFILRCSKHNVNFKYFKLPLGSYSGTGCSTKFYIRGQLELVIAFVKSYWYYSPIFILFVSLRIMKFFLLKINNMYIKTRL